MCPGQGQESRGLAVCRESVSGYRRWSFVGVGVRGLRVHGLALAGPVRVAVEKAGVGVHGLGVYVWRGG